MRVFADRADGLTQLIECDQVLGEGGLGADLLGRGVLGDRPVVDALGQPVQRRADGRAEDVGGLAVRQRGESSDGVDAESVQLLLGDRADAPQSPHRKGVEQHPLLVAAHHPDAVGFGQVGGDLGDLLARSGADGGDQARLVENLGLQCRAEGLDVVGRRADQFGRFAERLVERQLFEHGHQGADGAEHAAAGHAVHHAARWQHDRGGADEPAGLMHRHRRPGAVHPRFVAGARDDAAPTKPADEHRPSTQGGPGQLLDGREERVHVEVQHPTIHG